MRIWIADQNPLGLEEPPAHWQQALFDYDKMLRIMPSQKDRVYRLCRVVRHEARLGLQAMVVHEHPDTRACIRFGVVPIATLMPWAIYSPQRVLRDLRARDTWTMHGGDPNKIVDDIERQEAAAEAKTIAAGHEELDARSASAYRAIRYGRPELFDIKRAYERSPIRPVDPEPPLPALPPLAKV